MGYVKLPIFCDRSVKLRYILPIIQLRDVFPIVSVAVTGGLIGGGYGIVHDQITYAISPEYFTNLKFYQFRDADFGFGDRVFASTIGFLATWWVRFIVAWFLARRLLANQDRRTAYRQIRKGIACIFSFGRTPGIGGYLFGWWRGPDADYGSWEWAFREFDIADRCSFVRVAYIHNARYLGGVLGLIVALTTIRSSKPELVVDDCCVE